MFQTAILLSVALTHSGVFVPQDAAPSVDQLAWLAGCWARPRPDGLTEEHWMRPSGGTMIGMSRTVRGGRTTEFEFVVIRVIDGRLAYVAKPSGQAEATFSLKAVNEREVVFEDPTHDFPQRIIYRRLDDGGIVGRIEGTTNGQERSVDFPFSPCQT